MFEAYQGVQAANLSALKADIAQGVADINAGRVREVSMTISRRAAEPSWYHRKRSNGAKCFILPAPPGNGGAFVGGQELL